MQNLCQRLMFDFLNVFIGHYKQRIQRAVRRHLIFAETCSTSDSRTGAKTSCMAHVYLQSLAGKVVVELLSGQK